MTPIPPRPRWLIVLLILLALWQGGVTVRALTMADFIGVYTSLSIPFELAAGLVWCGLAIFALVAVFRRVSGAILYSMVLLSVFGVYSALRLALFARADYDRQRLPFVLVASLLAALVLMGVFAWRWRTARETKETLKDGSGPEN